MMMCIWMEYTCQHQWNELKWRMKLIILDVIDYHSIDCKLKRHFSGVFLNSVNDENQMHL